jgi:hypothetical protein
MVPHYCLVAVLAEVNGVEVPATICVETAQFCPDAASASALSCWIASGV